MIDVNNRELMLLKALVEKELENVEKEEGEVKPSIQLLEAETKYDVFLKELLKKLK